MKNKTLKITLCLVAVLATFGIAYGSLRESFRENDVEVFEAYSLNSGTEYIDYDDDDYHHINVDTSKLIGVEKAKGIALKKVPGANQSHIGEFHLDHEHGRVVYEGSIYYNGWEYEFDIDATTGNILKWKKDRD